MPNQLVIKFVLRASIKKVTQQELEKDLKEEKCKRSILRDRLTRAEGQLKMSSEKVSQLEAALEKSRAQVYSLERTVQMLHEQVFVLVYCAIRWVTLEANCNWN